LPSLSHLAALLRQHAHSLTQKISLLHTSNAQHLGGGDRPTRPALRARKSPCAKLEDEAARGLSGGSLYGLLRLNHVQDGVDQREMCERLWEVSEVSARGRIDLFTVQLERTGEREQLLTELARAAVLADFGQR